MGVSNEVLDLVNRFHEQYDSYRLPSYNEAQLRQEFVNPFFKALGWDVDNEQGYAEAYKEVIHEDSIKVGASTKAPDYSFRIGGVRKFFAETKKPAVNIRQDVSPAFQLRRYAWSAKLPLSILTDFEEFAVYDCRVRPDKNDKAAKARTLYLNYEQYDEHWDEIASIFSRDAILKGSFDKYAESTKKKRGTAEVDDAFLKEIEQWRSELARNLALRNRNLSQREINFAVQKTIDRIIFLRICEDRGIEPYGALQSLLNGPKIYPRLCELFHKADDRYNSGLFHFTKEKRRNEEPDEWTLALEIDDRALKDIIRKLYYPESPYEFSVLGADILGQVYEQFLGKVIRLTKGHQAKVEDKPEVKKAGGVYYTPTYIVDYIVEQTVGKLTEGKTPHEVAARTEKTWKRSKRGRPLSVLDPACGSGSFLIGAYQYLLDWYRDWYVEHDPAKHKDRIYQTRQDQWRLTTTERKRILLDHIYGVDIDPQAVEVTKLSLLLKVLEGENQESLQRQLRLFRERALPDLADNIKCGNSLIGPDFYQSKQLDLFDEDERLRINIFDWSGNHGFPEIMQSGGFDAAISNPPYIRIQTMKEWAPVEVDYYKTAYAAASQGNYDIYVVFVEGALRVLNRFGLLGFILPHKFFNNEYGKPLRGLLSKGKHVASIVHFGHQQVFEGATTYTCLLFLSKQASTECSFIKVNDLSSWTAGVRSEPEQIPATDIGSNEWNLTAPAEKGLFQKLDGIKTRLGDVAERIFQGLKTGADPVFILESQGKRTFFSKALNKPIQLEGTFLRPLYKSGDMKRYCLLPNSRSVIFPYRDGALVEWGSIEEDAPLTAKYLKQCKSLLAKRERGRFSGRDWYCFSRNQAIEIISSKKILTADLNPAANYCVDQTGEACFPGGAAGGYGIVVPEDVRHYVLGLLNSRCVDFVLQRTSTVFRGGWFAYIAKNLRRLPILLPTLKADVAIQSRIDQLVENALTFRSQAAIAKTTHERTALARQIEATDREIDRLVYELYGLSDEEIRIVEEATSS